MLNFIGVRESAILNNLLVTAKLAILAFFCIFGLFYTNPANFSPFLPLQTGVFTGAFYIFFAYGGFGRVAVVAEEVKDAKRNVSPSHASVTRNIHNILRSCRTRGSWTSGSSKTFGLRFTLVGGNEHHRKPNRH
jgi:amino acid transporter